MYKGIIVIINKGLGFKLTNFISFGESVISTGISKKPSRSTYSSKEIMELYCAIYMGRF
jgi:hypothetical protein